VGHPRYRPPGRATIPGGKGSLEDGWAGKGMGLLGCGCR
jgi:hypothetical protein